METERDEDKQKSKQASKRARPRAHTHIHTHRQAQCHPTLTDPDPTGSFGRADDGALKTGFSVASSELSGPSFRSTGHGAKLRRGPDRTSGPDRWRPWAASCFLLLAHHFQLAAPLPSTTVGSLYSPFFMFFFFSLSLFSRHVGTASVCSLSDAASCVIPRLIS